jgi:hypothetical protein
VPFAQVLEQTGLDLKFIQRQLAAHATTELERATV